MIIRLIKITVRSIEFKKYYINGHKHGNGIIMIKMLSYHVYSHVVWLAFIMIALTVPIYMYKAKSFNN